MFVDEAKIKVIGGNGGNGLVAFHREKYVAAGGPSGGDGGNGGSVILKVDDNLSTLMDFRYKKNYTAPHGEDGKKKCSNGKRGEDLVIFVPRGTIVKDAASDTIIGDLSDIDSVFVAARGGNGGWGNKHFATPTRQTPNFAKSGRAGTEREIILELKLIADVGLLGFPNVGKSTFLSVVSDAKPKIANYHFTTLVPNLGVVDIGGGSMVIADIPGIIEGASDGIGLGHEFLRHIERTRILIHIVDVSAIEGRDPLEDFTMINKELVNYSKILSEKEQVVVANKIDISTEYLDNFKNEIENMGYKFFPISAATKSGVQDVLNYVYNRLKEIPIPEFEIEEVPETEVFTGEITFDITQDDNVFYVEGEYITNLVNSTNFNDSESSAFFQRSLRKNGIIAKLEEMGINEGDTVALDDVEFDYTN